MESEAVSLGLKGKNRAGPVTKTFKKIENTNFLFYYLESKYLSAVGLL